MVLCDVCNKEMAAGENCSMEAIILDGVSFPRIRSTEETFGLKTVGPRCSDCGVTAGGFHHPGCAKEQCPACAEQLFCCDCEKSDEP